MKYLVQQIDDQSTYSVLTLKPADNQQKIDFEQGQYVAISAAGFIATPVRCFSIVSAPFEAQLQLAFRIDGKFTKAAAHLPIGTEVDVLGPFGEFTPPPENRPLVMLAGGIGITPFVSILRQMVHEKDMRPVVLLASNRSVASTPFYDEIKQLIAQLPNARFALYTTAPSKETQAGRINEEVLRQVKVYLGDTAYYMICGPDAFSSAMMQLLVQLGINESDSITEAFSQASSSRASRSLVGQVIAWSGLGLAVSSLAILAIDFANVYRKNQVKTVNVTSSQTASEGIAPVVSPVDTTNPTDSTTQDTNATSAPASNAANSYTAPSATTYVAPVSSGS